MIRKPANAPWNSRRRFMHHAVVASTATGLATMPGIATAGRNSAQRIDEFDLGHVPNAGAAGVTIISKDGHTFVAFGGVRDADGAEGVVVIALKGCKERRLRVPGDEEALSNAVDTTALDACKVYKVSGSKWARSHGTESKLQHLVLTFRGNQPGVINGGVNFECLTESCSAQFFRSNSFDAILNHLPSVA